MGTKASVMKNKVCIECGSPLWRIRESEGKIVEYACMNGHTSSTLKGITAHA